MTGPVYLTRATLRDDVAAEAAGALLAARGEGVRSLAGHHLVWTLFGDDPARKRDFLWREDEQGRFYILSSRLPEDRLGLFTVDPPRSFAPELRPGDRLRFALRVNATVARRTTDDRSRGKPRDVVMHALHLAGVPSGARAGARAALLDEVARGWLAARGAKHGFALSPAASRDDRDEEAWESSPRDPFRVIGYRAMRIPRGAGAAPMRIGVLDLEGELVVDDPAKLVARIVTGFGRARGFGCGLMLIRRAR